MGKQGLEDSAGERRGKENIMEKEDVMKSDDDKLSEKARGEAAIMMLMMEESKRRKKNDIRIKRIKMITRIIVALGLIAVLCAVPLAKKVFSHSRYGTQQADTKRDSDNENVNAAIEAEVVGIVDSAGSMAHVYTVRLTKVEQGSSEKSLIVGKEITIHIEKKNDIKEGDLLKGKITSFNSVSDIWTFVSEDQ